MFTAAWSGAWLQEQIQLIRAFCCHQIAAGRGRPAPATKGKVGRPSGAGAGGGAGAGLASTTTTTLYSPRQRRRRRPQRQRRRQPAAAADAAAAAAIPNACMYSMRPSDIAKPTSCLGTRMRKQDCARPEQPRHMCNTTPDHPGPLLEHGSNRYTCTALCVIRSHVCTKQPVKQSIAAMRSMDPSAGPVARTCAACVVLQTRPNGHATRILHRA